MRSKRLIYVGLIGFTLISLSLQSCKKDPDQPDGFKGFVKPDHFPEPWYLAENNPITKDGFELGRRLFFDPVLSADSTIHCGTCHAQVHAFADHGAALSAGVEGRLGIRNSPGLFNIAWFPSFMWDGGINHIEVMPIAPITDHNEMDETLTNVVEKLKISSIYPELFKKAFGTEVITDQKMLFALAQYMALLISSNSPYDQYVTGKGSLNARELNGLSLFRTHCESCHKEPLFTDFSFVNNGLDTVYEDAGRGRITQLAADSGAFKVPSLRNVDLTYPYMHDGRFFSLESVLDHYTGGVLQNGRLDARLPGSINLTPEEKEDIILFLQTLTDYEFLSDLSISEP
jgi:cytochrome c peroxidase